MLVGGGAVLRLLSAAVVAVSTSGTPPHRAQSSAGLPAARCPVCGVTVQYSTEQYRTVQSSTVQYLDVVEAAGEGEEVCGDHDVRAAEVHHAAPRVPVVANPQLRAVQGRNLRSGCRYVDTSV